MSKQIIIAVAVITAAIAAPVAAIAAPTASTIAGADAAAIAIGAPTTNFATATNAMPGFYIHTQRIPAVSIKKTVYDYGAGAISFVPPASQHSMPSIMLAGMPDKAAALHLIRAVSDVYRHDGKPFVASAECVSPKGHRYMYSFVYVPHAKDRRAIWQNVNGDAVTRQIADACPASDLIVSINPAK
jgi:hypothetical protein